MFKYIYLLFNNTISQNIYTQALSGGLIDISDTLIYRPDISKGTGITYYTTKYNPLDIDTSNIHAKITYQWVDFSQQVAMRAFKFRLLTSIANFNSYITKYHHKISITDWTKAELDDITLYKNSIDKYFRNMNEKVTNLHKIPIPPYADQGFAKLNNPIFDIFLYIL